MNHVNLKKLARAGGLAMGLIFAANSGTAQATSFTAQQLLSSFNLISSGNVSTQSDIEGSAVIGGNMNAATFFNNGGDLPANPSIILYGSLSGNTNINNHGTLYYTGTPTGVNFNGGSTQNTMLPNPLSTYTTPLTQLSTKLSTLASTAGATVSNGNFNANGATGLVVFNLTAAQLNADLQNSQITFTGGNGVTGFIVNVSGNYSESGGINFNTAQQNALFNFTTSGPGANVSLGNWKTSVLAPGASLGIQNGFIDGSVFAASFSGGGELHNDNLYDGALPTVATVPEAATWAMMLAGFAIIGLALRARRDPEMVLIPVRI